MKILAGLIAGLLFGLGLAVGGMTDPQRIIGFLDIAGDWDPTLIGVMGGAVVTSFIGYRLVWRMGAPKLEPRFFIPTRSDLDGRLLGGAALFGIGWGLSGYCPGPAVASLAGLTGPLAAFLAAMAAGWWIARRMEQG